MGRGEDQTMKRLPFHLDILVEMEEGEYVAHCLQFDLVAVAPTADQAIEEIKDLITAQIVFANEHDNLDSIFRPAPPEYWRKLWCAKQSSARCQRTDVTVNDRHNEADFCYAYA